MKKVYIIIIFFILLFVGGMAYFFVTIDQSLKESEETVISINPKQGIQKECNS